MGRAIAGRRDRGRAGHEVRQRARARRDPGRRQRAARIRAHARATRRCGGSASITSTSTTSTASTPRRRSRTPSGAMAELGRAGQGAPPRAVGGRARHDPPRPRRPPDHRAADRVVAVDARPRDQRSARTVPRARDRLRGVLPARARLPLRARIDSARGPCAGRLPAPQPSLPGGQLREQPGARRAGAGDRGREGRARPPSWRWPGCWPRATTSCRSPVRSGAPISRRTSPPTTSTLTADELRRIDEASPAGAAAGDRYADMTPVHR